MGKPVVEIALRSVSSILLLSVRKNGPPLWCTYHITLAAAHVLDCALILKIKIDYICYWGSSRSG